MKKFFSILAAVLFAGSMMAAEAVLQYTGGVTANMVGDGANNAATLGLDANLFTVLADKGSNQNLPGLNKANDIRLYADKNSGNGNIITVSIASGTITSIVLDIKQTATFVVKAGESEVIEANGAYAINAASFSIQNTTTGATTQLQFNKITITYEAGAAPGEEPVEPGDEPVVEPAALITFGDTAVAKGTWSNGAVIADKDSLVKLTLIDPDAKIAIDLNDANFGTTEEYVTLKSRLKTGGKSSASKNYINVEVAKNGKLYIMARTGSNSATDRNVVITNGTDTIFNQLLLESNATVVPLTDSTSMKIYPVYSATLNTGVTYRISYPVNGVNFYGFDFVPEDEPVVEPEGPKNLGAKTIAEFLELKNTTDTCILTGVVSNIVNATYGNFDLTDESGKVYVYGLLTPEGEAKKFAELGVEAGDTLTVLAIYNEHNGNPQVKNAIFVDLVKGEGGGSEGEFSYDYEPEEVSTFDVEMSTAEVEDYTAKFGVVAMYFESADGSYFASMDLIISSEDLVEPGEYQINDSEEEGTFFASPGGDDEYDYGCYFGVTFIDPEDGQKYYYPYYLVSGNVTITEDGIQVQAKSYNGSTVKFTYVQPYDAVENTKLTDKLLKAIENGNVIIKSGNVIFDVNGQRIK